MKRTGERTLGFENKPVIKGYASVAGKKESEGPLGKFFDKIIYDPYNGLETFEDAESSFQTEAVSMAIEKSEVKSCDIDCIFSGDLLNQCTGSSFGLRDFQLPFLGQYGACSTMGQGLIMSAVFTESGAARNTVCATSSHFCAAERQYRFPLEYGSVRTPTAQWTVTGAGSCVVGTADSGITISAATVGRITDYQVTDPNNMGAAMAPAAADTIAAFFHDTKTSPKDFDLILTGDLGLVGSRSLYEILLEDGIDIRSRHNDCGLMIFDRVMQDVHAGGSGCGCCAATLCSKILNDFENGILSDILFVPTGALLSTTSAEQKKSIPSIAHLINLRKK